MFEIFWVYLRINYKEKQTMALERMVPTHFGARILTLHRVTREVIAENTSLTSPNLKDVAVANRTIALLDKWPDRSIADPLAYYVSRYHLEFPEPVSVTRNGTFIAFDKHKELFPSKVAPASITTLEQMGILEPVNHRNFKLSNGKVDVVGIVSDPFGISQKAGLKALEGECRESLKRAYFNPLKYLMYVVIDQSGVEKEKIRKYLLVELIKLFSLLGVEVILIGLSLEEIFSGPDAKWAEFLWEYANICEADGYNDISFDSQENKPEPMEENEFNSLAKDAMTGLAAGLEVPKDHVVAVDLKKVTEELFFPNALYLDGLVLRYAFPVFFFDPDSFFWSNEGLNLMDFSRETPSIKALNHLKIPYYDEYYQMLVSRIAVAQSRLPVIELLRRLEVEKTSFNFYGLVANAIQHLDALVTSGVRYLNSDIAIARVGGLMLKAAYDFGLVPKEFYPERI